jgi:hypothetical protein
MKNILRKTHTIIITLIGLCINVLGAQSNGFQRITVAPFISPSVKISEDAKAVLFDKMSIALANNGIVSSPQKSRFILTSNVVVLSKNVIASAPVMYSYELQITFYIGDGLAGTKYSSISKQVVGVSNSDARAFIDAFRKVSVSGEDFVSFLNVGKKKIIEYYSNMCSTIINESRLLSANNDFSGAIYKLLSVPDACDVCYEKCLTEATSVYRKKINFECEKLFNQASNVWMSNMSYDGAREAGAILNQIDPNAICFSKAQKLRDEIKTRLSQIDTREWNLRWETEVGLQRDAIKAARDIAVAYAENQPDLIIYSQTSYNVIGWW